MRKTVYNFVNKIIKKPSFKEQLRFMLSVKTHHEDLYLQAFQHRSMKNDVTENNERLEYLGDAILGAAIADYLFKKYPYKEEGFLTEMRSKIVNRQQLNDIAIKMGLKKFTTFNNKNGQLNHSHIFGNTLEALVGAIYLDKGYEKTKQWILKYIVIPNLSIDDLEHVEINMKNRLIGWANKNHQKIEFQTIDESVDRKPKIFTVAVILNGEIVAQSNGFTKKDASQYAAQIAMEKLCI